MKSDELRSDRHVAASRRGAITVAGDIVGELSYGSYDDLLAAGFCGTWAPRYTLTAATISAANSDKSFNFSASNAPAAQPGDVITFSGFTAAGLNKSFTVVTATSAKITVAEAVVTEAAGQSVTLSGPLELKTGTTRRTFAILKRNLDIGLDTLYRGCEVNQIKWSMPLQEKITATFSMMGKSEETYTVPVGATFASKTTTDYMTTFEGSLDIASVGFNAATQMDVTLDNGMAQKYSLFNRAAYANKIGMIGVSGSLSAYIEDDALKLRYRNEVDTALDVEMVDKSTGGNAYILSLPRSRFSSASDSYSGDDFGIQAINFTGLLDDTQDTELKLVAVPATI